MKPPSSFVSAVVSTIVATSTLVACATHNSETSTAGGFCDCITTSFVQLELPASVRSDVTAIEVSGPACKGPIDLCDAVPADDPRHVVRVGDAACASVSVDAGADGLCHIEVKLRQRATFVADVTFTTPPGGQCGPACTRRPLGLEGGALTVPE
jgi:hypothetical protein